MSITRFSRMAVAGVATAALLLTGCSGNSNPETTPSNSAPATSSSPTTTPTQKEEAQEGVKGGESKESNKKASLADWKGTWMSLSAYGELPEMQSHIEEAAKEHGETVEEVKAEIKEARGTDFAGMVIDEDKIHFVKDHADVANADASKGAEYKFLRAQDVKTDKYEFTWYIFEGGEGAPHKYVLLMPLHGEESLAHFHMRYGDDVETAMNATPSDWFPTFVDPKESTIEQVAETLLHHDH